jgi:hypothetical protein
VFKAKGIHSPVGDPSIPSVPSVVLIAAWNNTGIKMLSVLTYTHANKTDQAIVRGANQISGNRMALQPVLNG